MKVFWLTSASLDRESILRFIAQDDIVAALDLDKIISEACLKLQKFPKLGKKGRVKNTFELVLHPHYFLLYQIKNDRIEVLALLHTSRQFP